MVAALGLEKAAQRARTKLIESLPDRSRRTAQNILARFTLESAVEFADERNRALSLAVRAQSKVKLCFATADERLIHPAAMRLDADGWAVRDEISNDWIPSAKWGRINVSAISYAPVE